MSGVYVCPYCLGASGSPDLLEELPDTYRCDCFPHHGQWIPVVLNGDCVGWVMLDSDLIDNMQTHAVATES